MSSEPMGVSQDTEACVLHLFHSPRTVINERHHMLPEAVQMKQWGEVRDKRTITICATVHNSIHYAYDRMMRGLPRPVWCTGKMREVVETMVQRTKECLAS